ncbi:Nucleolin [Heterocephalus glaber]|uniref:Nucleolin n=1 Tax=Heterocephalus glaber TaxID=10181 RepID=G5B976_HETGA|nr:Nucleolin [Heterocephalus glaber]
MQLQQVYCQAGCGGFGCFVHVQALCSSTGQDGIEAQDGVRLAITIKSSVEEEDDSEEAMETTQAKGKKAPGKAKNMAEEEEDVEDDEDNEDEKEDKGEKDEPVKEALGKQKKEMTKQKAAPEATKQKVKGTEPTTAYSLFVGNLNS